MPNRNMLLIAGGFVALAVIAIAGWTHKTTPAASSVGNGAQPAYFDANGQPVYSPATASQAATSVCRDNYGNAVPCSQPSYPVDSDQYSSGRYVESINRPVVVRPQEPPHEPYESREQAYSERSRDAGDVGPERPVKRGRSTQHSVEIVGGSAAAGAAIGAIAGGGKGAGIGALSGGAAGFIYDRLTHNR